MTYSSSSSQVYTLTFRDAYSGRSKTGRLTADTPLYEIIDYLEHEGILSFPACYVRIPGVDSLRRQGAHFPDVNDIRGVHSGMTLNLDMYQASDPRLKNSPNLRKAYPLVFYRKSKGMPSKKFQFLCYGCEYPSDIIARMTSAGILPYSPEIRYEISNWPGVRRSFLQKRPENSQTLPLCDINPKPGTVFEIQSRKAPSDPAIYQCLYGCPSAATPEHHSALSARSVDILTYD